MINKDFVMRLDRTFDGGTMAEVARRLGIPHATVRNYFQGRLPAPEVLIKIANETDVSLNWLLTGKGEMYGGKRPPIGLGRFIEEKIVELVDRRLDERTAGKESPIIPDEFDIADAIERLGDPQGVMAEWFKFEGREYPSDYGVVFFKGWDAFSTEQRHAAVLDAKRVLDRALGR